MNPQHPSHASRLPWIVLGISALLIAMLALLWGELDGWLAGRWSARLSAVSDQEAAQLLRQLSKLDEAGIPGLAAGLASPRPAVMRHSQRILLEQLADWELLRPAQSAPKLLMLAESLTDLTGRGTPQGRLAAAHLAQRILDWPGGHPGIPPGRVALACGQVIAAVGMDDERKVAQDQRAADLAARQQLFRRHQLARDAHAARYVALASHEAPVEELEQADEQSLTPLPTELVADGDLASSSDSGEIAQETTDQPATSPASNSQPPRPSGEPGRLPDDIKTARPILAEIDPPRSLRAATPQPVMPKFEAYGTVELVGLLYDENGILAARAEQELARRGFTGMHLELARRLTDPDPEVRQRWAKSLPGMQDLDARPWLLWLARDEETDVRHTALSLLATVNDPETLATVERIARDDADPRIQRIATKIVELRAGRKFR
ncbi:MAG: HEAT repeat domain-containing protein [Pirellulales bacterium]